MRRGIRLHDEHDHPELNGLTGAQYRLALNAHMMTAHDIKPTGKGSNASADAKHAAAHEAMASGKVRAANAVNPSKAAQRKAKEAARLAAKKEHRDWARGERKKILDKLPPTRVVSGGGGPGTGKRS